MQAIQAVSDAETKIASYAPAMRGIAGRLAPVLSHLLWSAMEALRDFPRILSQLDLRKKKSWSGYNI